jgi:hypothetical protein
LVYLNNLLVHTLPVQAPVPCFGDRPAAEPLESCIDTEDQVHGNDGEPDNPLHPAVARDSQQSKREGRLAPGEGDDGTEAASVGRFGLREYVLDGNYVIRQTEAVVYTDRLQDDGHYEGSLRTKRKCQSRMNSTGWVGGWVSSPCETYEACHQEVIVPPKLSVPAHLSVQAQAQEDCRNACKDPNHGIQAPALHVDNAVDRAGNHSHGFGHGQDGHGVGFWWSIQETGPRSRS